MKIVGYMCSTPLYEYNGWTFEYNAYHTGPWPVRKDGELYKRCGDKFYNDIDGFFKLSEKERNKYRVGGGCDLLVREEI